MPENALFQKYVIIPALSDAKPAGRTATFYYDSDILHFSGIHRSHS